MEFWIHIKQIKSVSRLNITVHFQCKNYMSLLKTDIEQPII